jgi:mRNA-degrading endonuclease RelE of RelBE toxin-antitoxin system
VSAAPKRRLTFSRSSLKGIQDLPAHAREACKNLLRELVEGTQRGKKLKGDLEGLRSIRLGQQNRIIYHETEEEIQVVSVGPRGGIYKG